MKHVSSAHRRVFTTYLRHLTQQIARVGSEALRAIDHATNLCLLHQRHAVEDLVH